MQNRQIDYDSGWVIVTYPSLSQPVDGVEFVADCYTESEWKKCQENEGKEFQRKPKPYQSFRDETCNGAISLAKEWCSRNIPF